MPAHPRIWKKNVFPYLVPCQLTNTDSTLERKKETQDWKSKQQGVLSEILMLQIDWHTTVQQQQGIIILLTAKYTYYINAIIAR